MNKEKIYFLVPHFLQNILISVFNILAYKKRYGGMYNVFLSVFQKNRSLTLEELKQNQSKRYTDCIDNAVENSAFYKKGFFNIEGYNKIENIRELPILKKEALRANIKDIYTLKKNEGILSKTGGTTGKSLEVLFSPKDMQERFAMLDDFRGRFGYKLGKKTAWFSGKNILNEKDIKKKRFWKTDYWYNVKYYSTFHIKNSYLEFYINNLQKYKPEFIVGFPSSLLEIAKYGIENNYKFEKGVIKAIFPTAETITDEMRFYIEGFFNSKMHNQYASSEGAPFIFECEKANLHLEFQSGVFEVLDLNNEPTVSGRLIVTSFTTSGTPLVRYDIGDSIELSNDVNCSCGNKNPLINKILGREDDYLFSLENGKINLGNISNALKEVKGVVKFQAIQNRLDLIEVFIVIDKNVYNKNYEKKFNNNWKHRVGEKTKVDFIYVDEIAKEKSGKYRMIKNNIKHLVESNEKTY